MISSEGSEWDLKNLRARFARFCYRNGNRGVANLMLYIALGNLIVYCFSLVDQTNLLYSYLRFDASAILHGQLWRLFSYIFTYLQDTSGIGAFVGMISLLCYYFMGRMLEQHWGVLRFNLYYLTGLVLMDLAALLIGCTATTSYLNMNLFLAVATLVPDTRFLLFYVIPIKAKYLAWFDLLLTGWSILSGLLQCMSLGILSLRLALYCLFPLVALANYFIFFGKEVQNLLPDSMRYRKTGTQRNYRANTAGPQHSGSTGARPYRHKCTVCGRTDTDFPYLEFRYCSRCRGYYCYCQDHIHNHEHIV